jgi:hypothetical protein
MKRVELHFTDIEAKLLSDIAKKDGRKRKQYCEHVMRKIIVSESSKK